MKKNSLVRLMVSVFFVFSSLAGCGDKNGSADIFGNDEKFKNLEEATLTVYFVTNFYGEEPEDIRPVLDEVEKRAWNALKVRLNFIFVPFPDYEATLKQVINSGEPCDMFLSYFYESFNVLKTMNDAGLALDITTLFPEWAPRYYQTLKPEDLAPLTIDGKLLAVRNNMPAVNRPCVLVRDELLQKYNTPAIQDLDELEAFMAKLKQGEEGMTVLTFTMPFIYIFAPAYGYAVANYDLGLVYKWDDPQMKVTAWEQTPEFPKAMERVYGWYTKGYLNAQPIFTADPILIRNKKWGVWIMNAGSALNFNEVLYTEKLDGRFMEFPLSSGVPPQKYGYPPDGLVVSKQSPRPERALMFIEWLHGSQENHDLLRYGIKGRHYNLKGEQYEFPEGVARNDSFSSWQGMYGVFADIRYERIHVSSTMAYRDQLYKAMAVDAQYPPHWNAALDFQGADTNLRKVSNYDLETSFFFGSYNADSAKEFIALGKAQGIDRLVAHVQSQLDAYRKQRDANP